MILRYREGVLQQSQKDRKSAVVPTSLMFFFTSQEIVWNERSNEGCDLVADWTIEGGQGCLHVPRIPFYRPPLIDFLITCSAPLPSTSVSSIIIVIVITIIISISISIRSPTMQWYGCLDLYWLLFIDTVLHHLMVIPSSSPAVSASL